MLELLGGWLFLGNTGDDRLSLGCQRIFLVFVSRSCFPFPSNSGP